MHQPQRNRGISRRALLAGAGVGALSLSPVMSAVCSAIERRAAGTAPPMRLVFCVKGNGLWSELIQPEAHRDKLPFRYETTPHERVAGGVDIVKDSWVGDRRTSYAAANAPIGDALSATMSPLEPWRDRVSVIQGLTGGFSVYHLGHYQALSATPARKRDSKQVVGPTIDSVFARALPAPVPHVCLGHDAKSASGLSYISVSAADRDKPNAFYTKPARAYADLFGVVDRGAAKARYDVQSSILDFHADDVKRLQSQVAGTEREQLDLYLSAFDTIRQSRAQIEAMADQLREHAPDAPGDIQIDQPIDIASGHADIAAACLISGLTNVVTICFDQLGSTSYPNAGGLHSGVGHGQGGNVPGKRRMITGSHFEQIAKVANKLDAIPEADGTMLDNTLFVYLADNGGTHHSNELNWPVVLLGDLGGRLKSGRYFAPGNDNADKHATGHTRLGDLWATLLAAAGQPYKGFGVPKSGVPHTPIEALL
ncbi:MAG: DUF1552 domain-containing protein [Phycisphaeraceae bacterium]